MTFGTIAGMGETDNVVEIVLTGGACGGKTTALASLAHLLRVRGVRAITIPEAFTMIVSGGVDGVGDMVRSDGPDNCRFQAELFRTIRNLRRRARHAASELGDDTVVIISDRGELDALAFHDLAAEEALTVAAIRDSYSAVMHLVTTADGAEDFYTHATNVARWETVAEARASDARLLEAWRGHPRHHILDNSTDFDGKVQRLLQATMEVVRSAGTVDIPGRPVQLEIATTA